MKEYKRIRELREDKELTQEKMARKLNITQRTYSRYENADSMLPLDILVKLADIHDVSTDSVSYTHLTLPTILRV